jgi:thiol-disulfide isomerase/thioredoxin
MPDISRPRAWWRWSIAAVIALVAVALGFHFGGGTLDGGGARGRDAAALLGVALPDADGQAQSLGQWKGKVLVVNFWATWCVPCREEMPHFVKAQRELGGRGLQFVGIAIDQPDKVQAFAKELGRSSAATAPSSSPRLSAIGWGRCRSPSSSTARAASPTLSWARYPRRLLRRSSVNCFEMTFIAG